VGAAATTAASATSTTALMLSCNCMVDGKDDTCIGSKIRIADVVAWMIRRALIFGERSCSVFIPRERLDVCYRAASNGLTVCEAAHISVTTCTSVYVLVTRLSSPAGVGCDHKHYQLQIGILRSDTSCETRDGLTRAVERSRDRAWRRREHKFIAVDALC
jgi:hypothetical protein